MRFINLQGIILCALGLTTYPISYRITFLIMEGSD